MENDSIVDDVRNNGLAFGFGVDPISRAYQPRQA